VAASPSTTLPRRGVPPVEPAPIGPPPASGDTPAPPTPGTAKHRAVMALFVAATFLGAGLLFAVEPMVAKMLLPRLGGSPAVWNTAMVFFQAVLLAGYAFAHLSTIRLGLRRHPWAQAALVAAGLVLLPIAVPGEWRPPEGVAPAAWTLLVLLVVVGGPFFVLATASPTLQRWFSATDHPAAGDPYFLYAAGNAGSLLALLGYPLLMEPRYDLAAQARLWAGAYVVFAALSGACAVVVLRATRGSGPRGEARTTAPAPPEPLDSEPVTGRTRLRWALLAAAPSALLLGVTRHLSTDIAAVPLLWVVPLALYLLTFVVAFARRTASLTAAAARAGRLLVVPLSLSFLVPVSPLWLAVALHLGAFFALALAAHGLLAAERPAPARLTEFYLWLSAGGVLGGVAAALVAPVAFDFVLEYPLALVAALALLPVGARPSGLRRSPVEVATTVGVAVFAAAVVAGAVLHAVQTGGAPVAMVVGVIALVGAYFAARRPRPLPVVIAAVLAFAVLVNLGSTLRAERTFFGVYRVVDDGDGRHSLVSGTTVHGRQDAGRPDVPLTYYHPTGPIGQWFRAWAGDDASHRVAVVGLGTGALAAYGRPGDELTFYEIDPAVVDIATDPDLFTYVGDSAADVEMVLGDGRLSLAATDDRYDLVVLDAFSSDAIPVHLMTQEALAIYRERLAPGGVIAFHVSNRYLDLAPVLARLAHDADLVGLVQRDAATAEERAAGKLASMWVLLAPGTDDLASVAGDERWRPLGDGDGAPMWTDSFSDVVSVLEL
jgi:SAM-dependent methyltransferase